MDTVTRGSRKFFTLKKKRPETSIPDTTQPQGTSSSEPPTLSTHQPTTHEPLSAMANDPYVLWCLIKGSSNPFDVTAPVATSFSRLKDLVWEKRKNGVLRGTDAADLVLWKVSNERLACSSQLTSYLQLRQPVLITDLPQRTDLQGDLSQCAIELQDPSETVLDKFSEAPQDRHVHIIVENRFVGELTSACPLAFSLSEFANRRSRLYSASTSRLVRIVYGIDFN
jgi:hypothetical protein